MRKKLRSFYHRLRGFVPVLIEGTPFKCHPADWRFWRKVEIGRWEPHTFRILSRFLKPDSVYFDVGAWIGPTVLYGSRRCREVYCFEPDPYAYERLLANVRLNDLGNVQSFQAALHTREGVIEIGTPIGLGKSESSILKAGSGHSVKVPSVTIDSILKAWEIQKVDMIKIDVEGGEFELLSSLADFLQAFKPTLYLSTHGPFLSPEQREELSGALVKTASIYRSCLDRNLQPLDPGEIEGPGFLETFSEIILSDEETGKI